MGFEVKYIYHPRKEEGGFDTETKEEKSIKIGKPFDDTGLEKLAAGVMSLLARRDIWVVDVKVAELVRKEVVFKECPDGRGIILKGRKFSFNEAAEMVADDGEENPSASHCNNGNGLQPHEILAMAAKQQAVANIAQQPHEQHNNLDDLYANPNKPIPIKKMAVAQVPVNQKKVLYKVYFDPAPQYVNEIRSLKLKFTVDKEYPVHQIIPHPMGKLDGQRIVVSDDTGRAITLDEKFFTTVGAGLYADKEIGFSGTNRRSLRKSPLMYESEMYSDSADPRVAQNIPSDIPLDDGSIPDNLLTMPEIRPGRKY